MNNQARICNLKCKYNIQGICHAYGECIAKDLFMSELEKIKTEIQEWDKTILCGVGRYETEEVIFDIIDKHIAELKGE